MCITGEQNKMWYDYTVEYYSVIKRNEVLIDATMQINLNNIILSERIQTKKKKTAYCMIKFT